MIREKIISAARGWIGTPYHHESRVKGSGVDCLQLMIAVYEEAGVLPEVEYEPYSAQWHFHRDEERYRNSVARYATEITEPKPGDFALFRFGRTASHAAIVIDWPLCIHSYYGQGVVEVDAVSSAELAGRLDSFWTLIDEEAE